MSLFPVQALSARAHTCVCVCVCVCVCECVRERERETGWLRDQPGFLV